MIWVGWFCFNSGSALAANNVSTLALLNTQMGASLGGFTQLILGYLSSGKFKATDVMNGVLSGLASVTPGSGFINPLGCCISIVGSATSY